MTPAVPPDETLLEAVTSAFRDTDPRGGLRSHPAWYDLDEDGRREAFERVTRARRLEVALDPDGLSTTGRAVLARIRRSAP